MHAGYDLGAEAILLCESDGTPEEVEEEIGRMLAVLEHSGATRCEVSADEATSFSCNAVVVGRTVVLNAETPKLSRALVEAGYSVRPTSLTEFIKAGGSAKCLTLRLDGEEAAAWRRIAAESIA